MLARSIPLRSFAVRQIQLVDRSMSSGSAEEMRRIDELKRRSLKDEEGDEEEDDEGEEEEEKEKEKEKKRKRKSADGISNDVGF